MKSHPKLGSRSAARRQASDIEFSNRVPVPPNATPSAANAESDGGLLVTLVCHGLDLSAVIAEIAAARCWRFECRQDMAAALATFGPLPGSAPRVFLLPLRLQSACGLEWTRRLAEMCSQARVVVLADQADAGLGFSAMYVGASAFLVLPIAPAELLKAVQAAARGLRFMSSSALGASLDALCCPESAPTCTGLTSWQIKVLWAIGQGRGEKGAASLLGVAARTVHTHATRIYLKLMVHSLEEALKKVFGRRACAFACAHRTNGEC
jgi:DNA-binding NarL/FixJ family response regulator